MEMEDVSDVEMELDRDEEVVNDSKLEDSENVDFEEEVNIIFSIYKDLLNRLTILKKMGSYLIVLCFTK